MRMGSHCRADVLTERLGAIQPVQGRRGDRGTAVGCRQPAGDASTSPRERAALRRSSSATWPGPTLRAADWFVTGTGTVQSDRYPAIVRPRRPVTVSGAGHLLDGRWYVQGVRHRWGVDPAAPEREQPVRRYEADVTVVRNALGGAGLMDRAMSFPFRVTELRRGGDVAHASRSCASSSSSCC